MSKRYLPTVPEGAPWGMTDAPILERVVSRPYPAGFTTEVDTVAFAPGLDETVIRRLSALKAEPAWLLDWRLAAYRRWQAMRVPDWSRLDLPPLDFQTISYHAAPRHRPASLAEVDPVLLATYEKLGVPLHERSRLAGVAIDAVFDSTSLGTTVHRELTDRGIVFCSFSEAVRTHPELVRRFLGSVVPPSDNFFAALNSAVFSDGSFAFIPKGVACPLDLSTYFRINARDTGQFERTLIVAEEGASVRYLEGCTAPMRDDNQLHAAVVELVALDDARIDYATVQNWYPGDVEGRGGILNFVTKRGECRGARSAIHWVQVETGSAITWKYPSCVLRGDDAQGSFHSVALTRHRQQADTGTKMIHLGRRTRSTVVSKGISAGHGRNTYRGLVSVAPAAQEARHHARCDSLLIGPDCAAFTFPSIEVREPSAQVEHEATTSRLDEDRLFYCRSRGLNEEDAVALVVNGFCEEVFRALPMEFALEARQLLAVSLEGAVG